MAETSQTAPPRLALVGNPNCGKSTLFNALTGGRAKTGNYPGVTVARHEGTFFTPHGRRVTLVDLPGTYSLSPRSPDERITRDVLLGAQAGVERPAAIVCVVDASQLERHLYLVTQIIDLGLPVLVVLNKIDAAEEHGLRLEAAGLSADLGVPVVPVSAITGRGVGDLKRQLTDLARHPAPARRWTVPQALQSPLTRLESRCREAGIASAPAHALLLLGDAGFRVDESSALVPAALRAEARNLAEEAATSTGLSTEALLSKARVEFARRTASRAVQSATGPRASRSDRFDSLALHPVLGWAILLGVFGLLFLSLFKLARWPMDAIDVTFGWMADQVRLRLGAGDLRDLLADGVIAGLGGVAVFLPQILILFFFIGLLEGSGYMARAAFLMDRLMGRVGLSGRAFVPLLSSYACAIPGILSTRTLEDPRQRLITILVAPFQSCSARLPVYSLLIVALFPSREVSDLAKASIMLGCYALGTGGALGFAWIFNRWLPKGQGPRPFLLELPRYRPPDWRQVGGQMVGAAGEFVRKAGTIILGLSILLWALATYPRSTDPDPAVRLERSAIGRIGKVMAPMVRPLGWDWKTGAAVTTSFAAREVFVSTMNILYHVGDAGAEVDRTSLGDRLRALVHPVEGEDTTGLLRDRMTEARHPDGSPVFTTATCLSLLVFYIYAMQCVATLVVTRRESGAWKWAAFQLGYQTAFAVLMAFLVFQGVRLLA